uniref:Uncharacterized protein n=1 Tax=Lepeophtheirus salmonis TaxID=72036 RepID=A0A0K2TQQ9_LEPSM
MYTILLLKYSSALTLCQSFTFFPPVPLLFIPLLSSSWCFPFSYPPRHFGDKYTILMISIYQGIVIHYTYNEEKPYDYVDVSF